MSAARLIAYLLAGLAAVTTVSAPWPTLRNALATLTGDATVYALATGYEVWAQRTFWFGALLFIAILVGTRSGWLGAIVGLLGVNLWLRDAAYTTYFEVALVILGMVALASAPETHRVAIRIVGGAVIVQAVYILAQRAGFDPLIGPFQQSTLGFTATGTLGNRDVVASLLAMGATIVTPWALLVVLPALVLTKVVGAGLAVTVGLALRFRSWTILVTGLVVGGIALAMKGAESLHARVYTSALGVTDWITHAPLTGFGFGGWNTRKPGIIIAAHPMPFDMIPAHNDPLQWGYEFGAIGAGLLALVTWKHRAMFSHPLVGASCAAILVLAFTEFPFHAVSTGLAAAVLIGVGISPSLSTTGA